MNLTLQPLNTLRDMRLFIDQNPSPSISCSKIKVLPSCIRTASKYGTGRVIFPIMAQRLAARRQQPRVRERESESGSPLDVSILVREVQDLYNGVVENENSNTY